MAKSVQSLKESLKKISLNRNINFNTALRFYLYDRFMERLSLSKYKDNFIFKGGFYLSKLFGIDNRTTIDIDATIMRISINDTNITKIINEIINVDIKDNVTFKLEKVEHILEGKENGGLRITIGATFENIRDRFHFDIGIGDLVYPGPIVFKYESIIDYEEYELWSYNIETVIAEKLEIIFEKAETTSRMKDFYDIYLIHKYALDNIDNSKMKKACQETFIRRKINVEIENVFKIISKSKILENRWDSYINKNKNSKKVTYNEVINCVKYFISILVDNKRN